IITAQIVALRPVFAGRPFLLGTYGKTPGGRAAGGFWLVETASSRSGLEVAMDSERDRDVVLVLDRVKAARTR
ncbi:MAG TPA: hypothetical protein VIY07_00790, partial [Pseudolabrys sp.]